ncbi:DUF190 domain-containing protein [Streptomyces sp. NPDC048341]|uniref:DUF190 domain-containing protein n=1 Tax=Streptomyces sp. NPDC048341 TaxID=3154620 RepID=UPI00343F3A5A
MPEAVGTGPLTIHVDEAVPCRHDRPAYAALVHQAHHERLAGAGVFHGFTSFTGFGAERLIHRERPAHLAAEGPVRGRAPRRGEPAAVLPAQRAGRTGAHQGSGGARPGPDPPDRGTSGGLGVLSSPRSLLRLEGVAQPP